MAHDRFLTTIGTRRKEDAKEKAQGATEEMTSINYLRPARSGGNQSAAARMLGISPQALNKRLKQSE